MVNAYLPKNHYFLAVENDMRGICNTLLNPVGITYFNYLRVYNDGTCIFVSTNNSLLKYHFTNNVPVAAPIDNKLIKEHFNYFVLPVGNYNKHIENAMKNFKLAHFIDLIDRHDEYMELFCFGSTPDNSGIINFYLNNLDSLNRFKLYFKDKARDLLKKAEKNSILLPDVMRPPYHGLKYEMDLNFTKSPKNTFLKIVHRGKDENIKLTSRQYDCLLQISNGCTAKEAAKNLGISHRTIENYLAHLKSIFDCHRKSELINVFLKNFK